MTIMKRFLLFALVLCGVSGCFSLRSEYQPMAYYRLAQQPVSVEDIGSIPGTLYVRTFTANEEFENNHIVYVRNTAQVDYYTYHRWISEAPELVTDFIASRYMQTGAFSDGVVQVGSSLMPEYVLEGKIIDMIANNGEPSNVELKLQCTLIGMEPLQTKHTVLWQHVYEQKVQRPNSYAASIAEAYSDALSIIADQLLVDIARAVEEKQKR